MVIVCKDTKELLSLKGDKKALYKVGMNYYIFDGVKFCILDFNPEEMTNIFKHVKNLEEINAMKNMFENIKKINIDDIQEWHHDNLVEQIQNNRTKQFNYITMEILGKDYYNHGADVYSCDSKTADDIVSAYKSLKTENRLLSMGFWIASSLLVTFTIFFIIYLLKRVL